MTRLRKIMLDELERRNYSQNTRRLYLHAVAEEWRSATAPQTMGLVVRDSIVYNQCRRRCCELCCDRRLVEKRLGCYDLLRISILSKQASGSSVLQA